MLHRILPPPPISHFSVLWRHIPCYSHVIFASQKINVSWLACKFVHASTRDVINLICLVHKHLHRILMNNKFHLYHIGVTSATISKCTFKLIRFYGSAFYRAVFLLGEGGGCAGVKMTRGTKFLLAISERQVLSFYSACSMFSCLWFSKIKKMNWYDYIKQNIWYIIDLEIEIFCDIWSPTILQYKTIFIMSHWMAQARSKTKTMCGKTRKIRKSGINGGRIIFNYEQWSKNFCTKLQSSLIKCQASHF